MIVEHLKVPAAVGLNALLGVLQVLPWSSLEIILTLGQISVAFVTTLYIGTKVWCMWRKKQYRKGKE